MWLRRATTAVALQILHFNGVFLGKSGCPGVLRRHVMAKTGKKPARGLSCIKNIPPGVQTTASGRNIWGREPLLLAAKRGSLPHSPSFPKNRTYKFKKTGMLHEGWIFPCMELFTMFI